MFKSGMEITLERNRLSARALVRGWKDGAYILMEMPDLRWKQNDQSPIVGRASRGGKYYGFTTKYLGVLPEINIVILEYPEDIVDSVLRTTERYPVTLPVTLSAKNKGKEFTYQGVITDLSKGGCLIRSQRSFSVNETFTLSGSFPTGESFSGILLTALASNGSDGKFEIRCRFDSVPPDDERSLSRFLGMVKTVHGA
ncbi:MAG: PilZ domain-containing protein [Nitrospinae bacterium]|nr:PilZ domain-containing protein [Nitrospinota bacterium]